MTADTGAQDRAPGDGDGGGDPEQVLGRMLCDSLDVALDVDHHVPPGTYTLTYDEPTERVLVLRAADSAVYDATSVVPVRRVPGLRSIRVDDAELERWTATDLDPRALRRRPGRRRRQAGVAPDADR
jgi:hypothetical protein